MTFNISNILGLERCHVHHDARFDHFIRLRGAQRAEPGKGKGRENEPALSQHVAPVAIGPWMRTDAVAGGAPDYLFATVATAALRSGAAGDLHVADEATPLRPWGGRPASRPAGDEKRKRRRASGIPVAAGVDDKDFNAGL